jgi:hypothetical protein
MASFRVTSGHGVIASVLLAISGLGPKRFGPDNKRRLSRGQDEARNVGIINPNLFRKRLTCQCSVRTWSFIGRPGSTFPYNEFRLEFILRDHLVATAVNLCQEVFCT